MEEKKKKKLLVRTGAHFCADGGRVHTQYQNCFILAQIALLYFKNDFLLTVIDILSPPTPFVLIRSGQNFRL